MGWFYALDGKQLGPVTDAELVQLVQAGTITATTLVWQPGQAEWKTYGEVSGHTAPPPAASAAQLDQAVCAFSGQLRPKREMFEYEGRWIGLEHRDAYFQRIRASAASTNSIVPGPYGYGGFWIRWVARLLDGLIFAVVTIPVTAACIFGFVLSASVADENPAAVFFAILAYFGMVLAFMALHLGYDIFCIRRWDATLGKRVMGLRILRTNGERLTTGRIVGRYFAHLLNSMFVPFAIGFIMAGFDSEKRALHDLICDTRVIKSQP